MLTFTPQRIEPRTGAKSCREKPHSYRRISAVIIIQRKKPEASSSGVHGPYPSLPRLYRVFTRQAYRRVFGDGEEVPVRRSFESNRRGTSRNSRQVSKEVDEQKEMQDKPKTKQKIRVLVYVQT